MPKFRIYVPVKANDIYEVECESREDAIAMWEEGLNYEDFRGTTDLYENSDVVEQDLYILQLDSEDVIE